MASEHQDRAPRFRYEPYDELLDDRAEELLDLSMGDGKVHVPTLAQQVLKELLHIGPSHIKDSETPDNIRRVKVGDRQGVWLGFDTHRDDEGYMAVDVVDAPGSDAAILAAMTAFVMRPFDRERVNQALAFRLSEAWAALKEQQEALQKRMEEGEDLSPEEIGLISKIRIELLRNAKQLRPLTYAWPLITYYRPEIREYSVQDKYKYAWKVTDYVNDFLRSLRNLQGFLEYGEPNRRLTPAIKQPQRDVRAAVLRDVDGLSYREIGERLDVPTPPNFEIKREHQTVRKMVENGRLVLEGAFGAEGWQDRAKAMKAEKAWWQSLSSTDKRKERDLEGIALDLGISIEEARRQV
jgi:hypothetical protein